MKTKMASHILKVNSNQMEVLNGQMIDMAKELSKLNPKNELHESRYEWLLGEYRDNRKLWTKLQQEIDDLFGLEMFLPDTRITNPKSYG